MKNDEICVKIENRSEAYDCTENEETEIWTQSSHFTQIPLLKRRYLDTLVRQNLFYISPEKKPIQLL